MALFVVDQEKCLRDGICVDECTRFLVEMKDGDSYPEPAEQVAKPGPREPCGTIVFYDSRHNWHRQT